MRFHLGLFAALTLPLLFVCAAAAPCLADAGSDLKSGQDLMKAGKYDDAIVLFSAVVKTADPTLAPKGQLCIGIALQEKKSYAESITALKIGIQTYPNAERVRREMLYRLGEVYGITGDNAGAIETYQSIAAQYPADSANADLRLAHVFFEMKKYPEAIALLKIRIAAHPDAGNTLMELSFLLGQCYRENGDLKSAVDIYQSLGTQYPAKADRAFLELGICLQLQEQYADAQDAFQKSVDTGNGASNEARLRIDEVLRSEKKYQEEIAYLDKLYAEAPELRADALTRQAEVMSVCLAGMSDVKSAIEKLQQVIEEFPGSPLAVEAQARIAGIQVNNLKEFATAESGLRHFMVKYPDYPALIVVAHDLAFCSYFQKNYTTAAALFIDATKLKEIGNYIPVCLYMAADCYMRTRDYRNAKFYFDRLISKYPAES
ncbi:MAG TPA: tetratricopeptide repeat protein [Armatimonadota bacterium]|jgi:TolA-binding protein